MPFAPQLDGQIDSVVLGALLIKIGISNSEQNMDSLLRRKGFIIILR